MFRTNRFIQASFSVLAFLSISLQSIPAVRANDIVATEDVVSGSSVFVFRESRKRPQERAGGGISLGSSRKKSYREKLNAQIASARKRKADAAKARQAAIAKARAKERLAKLKLSNTLAATAEKQMEAGDIAAATVSYRNSLKANPKNVEAKTGLSEALTVTGMTTAEIDVAAAIPYFDEAVKLDPKNEVAFTKLGEIHDTLGRNALAITNYEKALAIDPDLSSLYLPVALAYAEAGNGVKAEFYLAKAETAGIDSSDTMFTRAVVLVKQNKNEEALAAFDRIIAAEPNNGAAHYQRAVLFDKMGQSDKAIEALKKTTQVDSGYAAAWFDLGVIYYNKGEYKNALTAYQSAVKADYSNAKAHANLASTYRQLERYQEANVEYKIAAETIKDDPNLYSEWGFCLGKTAEWDRAAERLETAKTMSPTAEDESNVGWAYYNAAQADKAAKNDAEAAAKLEKAKASLQTAVQKDPNLDAAHLNLGSTYNSLGEHEKAVIALNEAVRLHNDWVIALNQLGLAHRGTNNMSAALNSFNRVVTLDGNNVAGLFNLGSTQYATGDKNGAKKTQARLKKLRPDLADQLGNIIAGKAIDYGTQKLKEKIRIPGIPF